MMKGIKAYIDKLEGLSAESLDQSAVELVRAEKQKVALLIAHIAEMSRRKAALACGYKSLFDYCVRRLALSEGSVAMRIQVANVAKRFPQLLVALANNRISLTVAARLAPHLREENVDKLLSDCAGMSKRAVEEYLVALRPKPVFNPSIRRRPSTGGGSEEARAEGQQAAPQDKEQPKQSGLAASEEGAPSQPLPTPSPDLLEPARTDVFNFRFSADESFKAKFARLAEVLGVKNPLKNMAAVFEKAIDISLEKKDPKKKLERRLAKEAKRGPSSRKPSPDEVTPDGVPPSDSDNKTTSRYIPSEVRERVHARAGHQCEFRGPDGTRCTARTGLEIDHERPFAIYRSHDERFLRLLCGAHNRLQAERVYGTGFIRAKIEEKRQNVPRRGVRQSFTSTLHIIK
jgi:hypothetical protein